MSPADRQRAGFLIDGLKSGLCDPKKAAEELEAILGRIGEELEAQVSTKNGTARITSIVIDDVEMFRRLGISWKDLSGYPLGVLITARLK